MIRTIDFPKFIRRLVYSHILLEEQILVCTSIVIVATHPITKELKSIPYRWCKVKNPPPCVGDVGCWLVYIYVLGP